MRIKHPAERTDGMAHSDKTKLLLAEELKRQCRTTQFSRITVGGLCAACGLDRRTFYYHFRDIYDLAAWVFDHSLVKFLPSESGYPGIHEIEEALTLLKKDASFYRRALDDSSQNALGRHILAHSAQNYAAARKQLLGTDVLSEADLFAIDYHCFGSLGIIRRWLYHDCKPAPELVAQLIVSVMPDALRQLYDTSEDSNGLSEKKA